jgi:hypothetical protein
MRKLNFLSLIFVAGFCASCSGPKHYDIELYRTTMNFHDDFKVMQLTDLHLGYEGDVNRSLQFVENSIKDANPDLIVLSGDSFMFGNTGIVNSLFTRLNNVCHELTVTNNRLTKFAFTYGNHDNQGDYHKYYINETIQKFVTTDGNELNAKKYAAFIDFKDDDLFGFTNYHIDLMSGDDVKYRLTILDSNSYHFTGFKYEYDVIHEEQLQHAIDIYNHYEDKDYLGLCFFHIPFEEFFKAREQFLNADDPSIYGRGEFGEGVSDPYINNGSFDKLRSANIQAYFVGHDHINYCDLLYNAESTNIEEKAIFSYGVKSTDILYHDDDMIGYKLINLKDGVTEEEFLSVNYINENFKNVLDRGHLYE